LQRHQIRIACSLWGMSNNNEEDEYNEEYSEGEAEFARAESPDQDDEQHAQKVNGKLEALQSTINNLTASLNAATIKNEKMTDSHAQLEQENNKLRDLVVECGTLKKKNQQLKDQLDTALALGGSSIVSEAAPKSSKGSKPSTVPGSSLEGGASQTSLFSGAESMSSKRIKQLEHELRVQSTSAQDIQSLRAKVIHMNERIRIEKEYKYRAEEDVKACQKKIDMLGAHMEKLVIHLKHEGAHKLRLAEQLRVAERENAALSEKCDFISRKSAAKDRLVLELREGSKVLEDQLRLMDEKYMELRTKLDYARELGVKKIKKAEKVAADLRIKFAMSNGSAILDAVPMPGQGGSVYGGESQWSNQGSLMLADSPYMHQGGSPTSRGRSSGASKKFTGSTSASLSALDHQQAHREPTMDGVLEKIRKQEGRKQDWTQEKLNKLVNRK
jgi:septal ring factor EnvC (AmiA/AmiB activator)